MKVFDIVMICFVGIVDIYFYLKSNDVAWFVFFMVYIGFTFSFDLINGLRKNVNNLREEIRR